jgi:hypothetical protein
MKFTEEAMPNWESEIKRRFRFLASSTGSTTNSVYHFWGDENGKASFRISGFQKVIFPRLFKNG